MNNQQLIEKAASVVNLRSIGDYSMGDVGCALVSNCGKVFTGVCIDVGSSMGFCAEHNAVGSMITEGEYQIEKIVAVWKDEAGDVFVLSPCGRCREFMLQVNGANAETEVLLGADESVKLIELLPRANSFTRVD
jgi:cytidine deaminase